MIRAVNLARHGYVLTEIAKREGIAPSTLHLWARTHEHIAAAFRFAKTEGPPLRVIKAIKNGSYTYDTILRRSGLSDEALGLALLSLIENRTIRTLVVTRENRTFLPFSGNKRSHIKEEVRVYWLTRPEACRDTAA